jgi:hypothetical protein
MSQPAPQSVLTLGDQRTIARAHAVLLEARRRVALENRLAAGTPNLSHADPCWQLASEVSLALDGDVLAPATRRQLLERAGRLGVRQFDANLLIALVQDRARRGETIEAGSNPIALINQRVAPRLADPMPFVLFATAIGLAIATVITVTQWLGA